MAGTTMYQIIYLTTLGSMLSLMSTTLSMEEECHHHTLHLGVVAAAVVEALVGLLLGHLQDHQGHLQEHQGHLQELQGHPQCADEKVIPHK